MNRFASLVSALSRFRVALVVLGLFAWSASSLTAAEFNVVSLDVPGEGFNDRTSAVPVGGNRGSTLGEQRRVAFDRAVLYWSQRLESPVPIRLHVSFDSLPCGLDWGDLAKGGADDVFRDFVGAPFANTWYHAALADRLAGTDLGPGDSDLTVNFNSRLDTDPTCLPGTVWYYGFDEAPAGTVSFIGIAYHQITHGLGLSTFVDLTTGVRFNGSDDILMRFLEDHSTSKLWSGMTNAERATSATNSPHVHWIGPNVLAQSTQVLSAGLDGDHVRMHTPPGVVPDATASHWDPALKGIHGDLEEVMEPNVGAGAPPRPFFGERLAFLVTDELLEDVGWNSFGGTSCVLDLTPIHLTSETFTGTETVEACTSITADTSVVVQAGADVTFLAGQAVILGNGFVVESGAVFTLSVNGASFE